MYFKYISGRKGSELRKIWKPVPEIGIDEIDFLSCSSSFNNSFYKTAEIKAVDQ